MSATARWVLTETDPRVASSLSASLALPLAVARVLVRRGYTEIDSARRFLNPSLDDLHSPFLLKSMGEAVERLIQAIRKGQPILLFGDYDVDGTTSIVILKAAIERVGGQVSFYVPNRLREGYGLRQEAIETAARAGVKLLVSVDTGIRARDAVVHARELGIDVIVTDHHQPEEELPPAVAVLNPKRPDCTYPEKNLCGAGVAFKLVQALLQKLGWPEERRRRLLASLLKLVAIATVADVVPLTGENRILVKHGLEGLRSVRNVGLRALLEEAGFAEGVLPTAREVAFRIAPRMNAAGRMADAGDVIDLFLTTDGERARKLAAQLSLFNQERQQAETEIVREILEECGRFPVTADQRALVFSGANWHRGVLGIVASRLVERFLRPAIVLGEDPETGVAQGSGRSIPAFDLLGALESMPDLFVQFGGHRQAAGVALAAGRVQEFRQRLNAHAGGILTDQDLIPVLEIDSRLDLCELDDAMVDAILSLAPFGFGNPMPVFAVLDASIVSEPVVMKERHLRFSVCQRRKAITVKAWNFAERLGELGRGARIDLACSLELDNYALQRGYPGWFAVAKDVRPAATQ